MENEKIFLRESLRKRRATRTKEKESVLILVERITELNNTFPRIKNPIDKTSMKYLSDLYSETIILIENITVYMVKKNYCGIHETIDNTVIKAQDLIGILKEFKDLDTTREFYGFIDKNSQIKASSLLLSLRVKLDELLALKKASVRFNDTSIKE